MFEGEYVGYDSSINIQSYRVSGSREVKTGFEARKRRQTWKHDQLAKGTARLGKFQHLAAAGPNSPGDIAASVATLGSGASHEGLISRWISLIDKIWAVKTFHQPTSSLQQTSNRSFLLGVLASTRFRVEAE